MTLPGPETIFGLVESGLNTCVDHGGRRYHVQTQFSFRSAPVIESLVFHGGQALVRMTASYEDVAARLGFNGDDGRHLLELQHADLIRKIRHGMLGGKESPRESPASGDESPRLVDSDGLTVDPGDVEDPSVLALLDELGVKIDGAPVAPAAETAAGVSAPAPIGRLSTPGSPTRLPPATRSSMPTQEELPWWQRIRISLRF